ncbi:MAG: DPP IV N-terminal domain-containing protein [Acidobacteriota bacterium]
MLPKRAIASVLTVVLGFTTPGTAQTRPPLSIDLIMRGPQFYGYAPQDVRWSGDGERIYFRWKQTTQTQDQPFDTWVLPRASGPPRKLTDDEARLAPPLPSETTFRNTTRDRKKAVYAQDGDLYLYDFPSDKATQLTRTTDVEKDPHFSQDERRVAFTRGGNLYVMALSGTEIVQMTDIQAPGTGKDERKPADPKTALGKLQTQEAELLTAVRDRARRRDEEEAKQKREHPRQPFKLEAKQSVQRLELCPNEKCVVAVVEDAAKDSKGDDVPNYVTETSYTAMITGRTNVGDAQENNRVLILDTETGAGKWVEGGWGARSAWQYAPIFNEQGTRAAMLTRANDNKDRWVSSLDLTTAKAVTIFTDHDDAWIDGPAYEMLGWLKNSDAVYFISERDGWSHLYTVPAAGGSPRQITSGKFEVEAVSVSNDGSKFYMTTSEVGPARAPSLLRQRRWWTAHSHHDHAWPPRRRLFAR